MAPLKNSNPLWPVVVNSSSIRVGAHNANELYKAYVCELLDGLNVKDNNSQRGPVKPAGQSQLKIKIES